MKIPWKWKNKKKMKIHEQTVCYLNCIFLLLSGFRCIHTCTMYNIKDLKTKKNFSVVLRVFYEFLLLFSTKVYDTHAYISTMEINSLNHVWMSRYFLLLFVVFYFFFCIALILIIFYPNAKVLYVQMYSFVLLLTILCDQHAYKHTQT